MDLNEIYQTYFSRVYNFIFYKVLHKETAEDITSIVFLKVAEKLHLYDADKAGVSTWIFTVAKNSVTDYFRSRASGINVNIDDIAGDTEPALSVDFEEQSQLIADETRRELYLALSSLDARARDILTQKYFEKKSIREIADCINMNESSVSTIHNRALEKLRKIIKNFDL
ncbi:MAG: sigma-70 family RNA polymerase sigma factor [Oscillospiraceae bacterium]|nr:sigma-70 family RNA polymerase sigma factor [Oscillospiraceae bacterium]